MLEFFPRVIWSEPKTRFPPFAFSLQAFFGKRLNFKKQEFFHFLWNTSKATNNTEEKQWLTLPKMLRLKATQTYTHIHKVSAFINTESIIWNLNTVTCRFKAYAVEYSVVPQSYSGFCLPPFSQSECTIRQLHFYCKHLPWHFPLPLSHQFISCHCMKDRGLVGEM